MRATLLIPLLVAALGATAATPASVAQPPLRWTSCDPASFGPNPPAGLDALECATFQAPLDWHRPGAGQITIAVSRLRAAHRPAATLFTNPGGPGAAGRALPLALRREPAITQHFEVIGMDVRGTGASTRIGCGTPPPAPGTSMDPRDRSRANLTAMLRFTAALAAACQRNSGALGAAVTTAQTAADFDLLRRLLGRDRVSWYGISDGTWLAAHYATLFPRHVNRIVFDSTVDFSGTRQAAMAEQPRGFERRFRADFLPWIARNDAVYHLGDTAAEVYAGYEALRTRLARAPVNGMDGAALDATVAGSLKNKAAFPSTAALLSRLHQAPHPATTPSAGAGPATVPTATVPTATVPTAAAPTAAAPSAAEAEAATGVAIQCNDTPYYGDPARDSAAQGARYPLFGWQTVFEPCAYWRRPPGQLDTPTGRGIGPTLMVDSVHDPATPYEGAVRAHRAFAGSRLLTVTGEGDHGLYGGGNPCVDAAVNRYLTGEWTPQDDLTCPGEPLPAAR